MTKEERIAHLKILKSRITVFDEDDDKQVKALQETVQELEQEPCVDAVSRADARHLIAELKRKSLYSISSKAFEKLYNGIDDLPPVNPQPKTGHWIDRHIIANRTFDMIVCSECGNEFSFDAETGISEYNYCPNCGAKMVEPQERSKE